MLGKCWLLKTYPNTEYGALDYCIAELIPNGGDRTYALILFASSYVTHTFQVRPFTNSIETVLVALSMVALRNLVSIRHTENVNVVFVIILPLPMLTMNLTPEAWYA